MIDVFLYSVAIPLTIMLILSATVFEVQGYDKILQEQDTKVFAISLADMLISRNSTKRVGFSSIEEDKISTLPGNLTEITPADINRQTLGIPDGLNVTVKLNNTSIYTENNPKAENIFVVKRYVVWKGEPAVLELEVAS